MSARSVMTPIHQCVKCRALPERPFDPDDVEEGVEYRPKTPRPTTSGGPRSRVCKTHERAGKRERSARQRATHKTRRFGLSAELQQALWVFQGRSCPCGRKHADEVPPGVTLDHDHGLARLHDHLEEDGCLHCVTGFVCAHCNIEIIGRLEGSLKSRDRVAAALHGLHSHLSDPPLARLFAARPELIGDAKAAS